MTKIFITTGILDWPRYERISDRYGSVNLNDPNSYSTIKLSKKLAGHYGRLVAEVKETRKSHHIGDFCRGLSPSTPNIGDTLILGEGTVFFDEYDTIGLEPKEKRESDWLNPEVLYQLHNQTVDLYFIE